MNEGYERAQDWAPPPDDVLAALLEAGPEAAEHLLKAAQELLLAAKAVVDAGERALEAHRAASGGDREGDGEGDREGEGARGTVAEAGHSESSRRIRRIDLA